MHATAKLATGVAALLLAAPASGQADDPAPASEPARLDATGTYLRPNVVDRDRVPGYIHVTPDDAPLVVAIGYPKESPRYGSRKDARAAAVEGMRLWENAIQPRLPWFRLEFEEEDAAADVEVVWKRRITGPFAGFGRFSYRLEDARLRVGGEMQVAVRPGNTQSPLTVDEVRLLVAHEFGHVLGLGHCLDCDSAMNYAWHTRDRILVTQTDVDTVLALVARPSGHRVDGRPLLSLVEAGWRPPGSPAEADPDPATRSAGAIDP